MNIPIAVGHGQVLTERVDSVADLLRGAGIAGDWVGILDRGQDVVGIKVAAAGDGDPEHVLGGFVSAARHVGLNS